MGIPNSGRTFEKGLKKDLAIRATQEVLCDRKVWAIINVPRVEGERIHRTQIMKASRAKKAKEDLIP